MNMNRHWIWNWNWTHLYKNGSCCKWELSLTIWKWEFVLFTKVYPTWTDVEPPRFRFRVYVNG